VAWHLRSLAVATTFRIAVSVTKVTQRPRRELVATGARPARAFAICRDFSVATRLAARHSSALADAESSQRESSTAATSTLEGLAEKQIEALKSAGVAVDDLRRLAAGFAPNWETMRTFVLVTGADESVARAEVAQTLGLDAEDLLALSAEIFR
jgi:hypothetical protein